MPAVPQELLEFRLEDWSGEPLVEDVTPAMAWQTGGEALIEMRIREASGSERTRVARRAIHRWSRARDAWAKEHGWPTGDVIDQLQEEMVERRRFWREFRDGASVAGAGEAR